MKKLIFTIVILLSINQISNAQGQGCLPGSCPPCPVICNIINDTDCDLDFAWGYLGTCGDPVVPAGKIFKNSSFGTPNPLPWIGPCMSFCDGPCQCPDMFRVFDPNTNALVDPWGGAIFNCCWSGTYNNIFDCWNSGFQPVNVTVNVINGCITFHFHY